MASKDKRKGRGNAGSAAALAVEEPTIPGSEDRTQPGVPAPDAPALQAQPQLQAAEPVPSLPKPPPPSLASRVADAAAAQLLLFDELPADEKPRPDDRVLLVGLIWGGSTLIELEQVLRGADLAVGKLFDLPAGQLAKNFQIVKHVGDGHVFTVPTELRTEVHQGKKVDSFDALSRSMKARLVEAPFRGYAYTVAPDDRVVVQVAPQLTLIARYVRAARHKDKTLFEQVDIGFASTLLVALLGLLLFFLMVSITPRFEEGVSDDLTRNQNRFTKYQVKPAEKIETPKFKDLSGAKEGAKAKEKEGKLGKEDAKKKEADPSQKGAPIVDPDKKEADRKKVMKLGLVAALSKMGAGGGSAASNVLGPGGLGTGINNALGGVKGGAGAGDAYGVGGMGSRGSGAGGGGTALGIGGLGTKGGGGGRGGYGEIDLGGRGKDETIFVPGHTTVVGGLSKEVINRVIQKHYNEIKYCYEKELSHDPGLYGKITVLFVIEGSGHVADALVQQTTMSSEPVESCMLNHVKRWLFPQPQGGGTVQVTYPYVFKSSGQ